MQSIHDVESEEKPLRGRFRRLVLDRLFDVGVETCGIERVPEDERESKRSIELLLLWFGFITVANTVPVGMLAQASFQLTLAHAVAVIVGFGIIGCSAIGFVATLGPRLGMRTMVITRYSYGYWGGTIISFLNVLTILGFSVTSIILSGQILHNVNHNFPLVVGVITVGIISFLICFIGLCGHAAIMYVSDGTIIASPNQYNRQKLIHYYARYAWIGMVVIFIIIFALGGHAGYKPTLQISFESPSGHLRAANVLSFGSVMFSSAASWAVVAGDVNCRLPTHTNTTKIFFMTFFGSLIPTIFGSTLGAVLMTVPRYATAYEESDAAGVFQMVLQPWGKGGDFILVLLSLSVVANNSANTYSTALSMQTLIPAFRHTPRAVFTAVAFIMYTIIGVVGRERFSAILSNFLGVLGYWVAFWIITLVEEHFIFRRQDGPLGGYDLEAYDTPSRLPVGIAAIVAGLCGIAGAVVAMAQTWYIGPIAAKLGPLGGNMGFEFAVAFAGVVYPPLRWIEIRKFGR